MKRLSAVSVAFLAALTLLPTGSYAGDKKNNPDDIGNRDVGKGVVRDPTVHRAVCERIHAWWDALPGWRVLGITESPITGPEGNREFLIAAEKR